jgi:hypothetical protein
MSARRWLVVGVVAVVAVVGFLLFRPDTLFTDVEANESLEDAFSGDTTLGTEPEPATTVAGSPSTTLADTTTTDPDATEISQVATGEFVGIDHSAIGSVNVFEQDGRFVLRFEDDTDIQNGPDLYVWVLASESYEGGTPGEYLDLGTLTGSVGAQNYELPDEYDPELHRTVLIWCLRFAVPFAAARLG